MKNCWRFLLAAVLICGLSGCEQPEPIVTYRVPTKLPEQLLPSKDRMLAAMLSHGDQVWFVKVSGPEAAIAEVESSFRDFVTTLGFDDGQPVLDSPPDGWRRSGDKPMRYASFNVETTNKQLDVSISALPKREDWDAFVADNVNRWRGQLGLQPSEAKWADAEEIEIAASDRPGIWVDILGVPTDSPASMSAPFANRGGSNTASSPAAPTPSRQATANPQLKFDRPDGWRDGKMASMRLAAFNVGPIDSEAEVTVIAAGGGLRENVDRWLGQIRGGDVPSDVVDQALKDAQRLEIAGRAAQRFVLTGQDGSTGNAIDATIVSLGGGTSMFIKMTGPAATVSGQAESLTAFLQSLQF